LKEGLVFYDQTNADKTRIMMLLSIWRVVLIC